MANLIEEYLTLDELSARIKYRKQTLYNLIHKGVLVIGRHYLKPTPKKLLFKWSEISAWLGENSWPENQMDPEPLVSVFAPTDGLKPRTRKGNLIRI
jgi:hypothetical protein